MPRNFDFIRSLNDDFFLTVRRAHLINLYELLVTSLSDRNYCRANRIVEILLQCPEVDVTHVWRAAIDVLMHLGNAEKTCIDFFNQMLLHTRCKEEVLLELISFQLHSGKPRDALEILDTYLTQQPYKDNPLIFGYTGMLAFALWEQTNVIINGSSVIKPIIDQENEKINEKPVIHDLELCIEQQARYYELSISSLRMALEMDKSNDMFLVIYTQLLLADGMVDEALDIVRSFCNQNPHIVIGHRLLFDILYKHRNEDTEWVQAGKTYHRIDPVSPPEAVLNPLINYYENVMENQTSTTDKRPLAEVHYNILELLFQRIENGDDEFEYVKDAIVNFTWLEFFDPQRELTNILLENRAWFRKFFWFPNNKTITCWQHMQYYRILAVFCGCKSQGMIISRANKLKYYILTGKGGEGLKGYLLDFRVKKLKELRENVENIFGYYLNEVVIPEPKSDQLDINSENEDGQSSDADYISLEDDQIDQLHISSENEDAQSDEEDEAEYISLEDDLLDYLYDEF
ncbi:9996_t:CDS:10 [Dentiscutata erythropus]|uniref:9996_t:CDS:1 n=1 Tax=Dentiscutata erythropus TaxID=1348616 RepID=A0A9N9N725_9GLOM|nr:9996_t:CDS:10 [Dentiscutata erythropus]